MSIKEKDYVPFKKIKEDNPMTATNPDMYWIFRLAGYVYDSEHLTFLKKRANGVKEILYERCIGSIKHLYYEQYDAQGQLRRKEDLDIEHEIYQHPNEKLIRFFQKMGDCPLLTSQFQMEVKRRY